MSNFWSSKVAPKQAPQQPQQQAPNQPWWAPRQPQPSQVQPVAPVVNQPQQQVQYGSGTPSGEQVNIVDLLSQPDYQTTKAKSSTTADLGPCPDCGGPNYVGEDRKPNSMPHCYDCGYNPRFSQTMSGVTAGQNIPVKQARQQHATVSDFSPGVIIGKA